MKPSRIILIVTLVVAGCSLASRSPTATVNAFKTAYDKADFDKALSFCTQSFINNRGGAEKLKQDLKHSYEQEKADGQGKTMEFSNMKEHVHGDKAEVCWLRGYRSPGGMKMMVHLVKQAGSWKIDDFGSDQEVEECLK